MDIDEPDANGDFTGWFNPKGGGARQKITGKCSAQKPHMTVKRAGHKYEGSQKGSLHMKGKHNASAVKERKRPVDDDEWIATKVTRLRETSKR